MNNSTYAIAYATEHLVLIQSEYDIDDLHVHRELDGPGILIHDDDCADDEPTYVISNGTTHISTRKYGPRHPARRTGGKEVGDDEGQ